MSYKVIQWATGNVGRHALRGIIERPDFELVGVFSYDPAKIGRDAGELIDRSATGIAVTSDKDAIAARKALQSVLDDHKALAGHPVDKQAKKQKKAQKRKRAERQQAAEKAA